MSTLSTDQTLLIRALNTTRQTYFPSYVGLRLLGEQLSQEDHSYLSQLILRRLSAGDQWRFRPYKLYKGMVASSTGPSPEYRECLAPSPIAAVAEAVVLSQLASALSLAVPARVYSYLWPRSHKSGTSYRYFVEGYKKRNIEIGSQLRQRDSVAVITDLKGFYPSVDRQEALKALKKTLEGSVSSGPISSDALLGFYSQMLSAGGGGIPIGPASCHVLGHVMLKDVDAALTKEYGDRYFRYVDDIIVVCDRAEAAAVVSRIQACVSGHGFRLNSDKTLRLDGDDWKRHVLDADVDATDDFRTFAYDLAIYLAVYPGRALSLGTMLSDAGFSVPIQRLEALANYGRFRHFVKMRAGGGGVLRKLGMLFVKEADFVERCKRLKIAYERSLDRLVHARREDLPNMRRWQVQRVRRLVNSLFYLRPFAVWSESSEVFKAFPELVEQRALATALATGTVNPILSFSGRGPSAFAELWVEHGASQTAKLSPMALPLTSAERDSLITLRLHGVVDNAQLRSFEELDGSRLLKVANQPTVLTRAMPDLSFEDEFESLRIGTSDAEMVRLARTRYSPIEGAALDALYLSSTDYRS